MKMIYVLFCCQLVFGLAAMSDILKKDKPSASTYQNVEDALNADGCWDGYKKTTISRAEHNINQFTVTSKTGSSKENVDKYD